MVPQGITLLQNHEAQSQEDKRSVEAAQVPILLNLSLTYFRLERPTTSLKYGQRVLEMDPNNAKALYRCGQVSCLSSTDIIRGNVNLDLS